jgi:hypothetical protein
MSLLSQILHLIIARLPVTGVTGLAGLLHTTHAAHCHAIVVIAIIVVGFLGGVLEKLDQAKIVVLPV